MMGVAVAALTACNNSQSDASATADKKEFKFSAAQLSDPKDHVCGMDVDMDEMIADTMLYNGKIYGFCDPGCKEEFAKNPEQYLAQNQE